MVCPHIFIFSTSNEQLKVIKVRVYFTLLNDEKLCFSLKLWYLCTDSSAPFGWHGSEIHLRSCTDLEGGEVMCVSREWGRVACIHERPAVGFGKWQRFSRGEFYLGKVAWRALQVFMHITNTNLSVDPTCCVNHKSIDVHQMSFS